MAPNTETKDTSANLEDQQTEPKHEKYSKSFPHIRYPPFREAEIRSTHQWLNGKRMVDGAENLWRIDDGLYDFSNFQNIHPGGEEWLSLTKGTDITEAFFTHHLKGIAETIITQYYVRKAKTPRNSPFTMKDDGFYKTLKRKAIAKLKEMPESERKAGRLRSKILADSLCISLYVLAVVNCWMISVNPIYSVVLTIVCGALANYVTNTGHTFFHQADNFRMYYFNIIGLSHQDWRISHALCHHMYTNTAEDLELSLMEPALHYVPYNTKNKTLYRITAKYHWPLVWMVLPTIIVFKEYFNGLTNKGGKTLGLSNLIVFILPTVMYLLGGQSLITTLGLWYAIAIIGSWMILFIAVHAGHHNNKNFFEGDKPSKENIDWGEHELNTICERKDRMNKGIIQGLLHFGDHVLHHMFPTLDPLELRYLYPIFTEHCKQFGIEHKKMDFLEAIAGHKNQLQRSEVQDFSKKN